MYLAEDNYTKIYDEVSPVFDKEEIDLHTDKTWTIKDGTVEYKNGDLLVAYFQWLADEEDKETFCEVMIGNTDRALSSLCFYTLFRLGYTTQALNKADKVNNQNYTLWIFLRELFRENIYWLDSQQMWILKSIISNMQETNALFLGYRLSTARTSFYKVLTRLRFEHFERSIQGINLEINSDKKQVQEYLKNFWFDDKYNLTLNKLDQYIQSELWEGEVVPWWVIGILREFFKDFYMDLARKIAQSNWLSDIPLHPSSTTDIGHARQYIKEQFNLSSDEHTLLDSYKDITNNAGSHALLSEKKYLRLARNIGIEISLFMLEKLNDYTNKQKC